MVAAAIILVIICPVIAIGLVTLMQNDRRKQE
jgi:hypothetical protein